MEVDEFVVVESDGNVFIAWAKSDVLRLSKTLLKPNVVKRNLRMYEDAIIVNAYLLSLNAFD